MIRYYKIVTNIVLFIICENNMGSIEMPIALPMLCIVTDLSYRIVKIY